MSDTATATTTEPQAPADDDTTLAAELEVLREENERLRDEYVRARQSQYRRTAILLGAVGLGAVLASVFLASARGVLLALGGTGVFLGILTYYLTPERFLSATTGRDVYDALAHNEAALVSELGLQDDRVYVPHGSGLTDVRLFVPQHTEYDLPDREALGDVLVVTGHDRERGVAFRPAGTKLVGTFEQALTSELGETPAVLAEQLTDALIEQFELAETATSEVDSDPNRVTVAVTDSSYGPVETFDHPIASFLAVGLAGGLDTPITLSVEPTETDRADYLITCRWNNSST